MDSCDQLMDWVFFDRDDLTFNVWLLGKGVHETTSLKCLGQSALLFWVCFVDIFLCMFVRSRCS